MKRHKISIADLDKETLISRERASERQSRRFRLKLNLLIYPLIVLLLLAPIARWVLIPWRYGAKSLSDAARTRLSVVYGSIGAIVVAVIVVWQFWLRPTIAQGRFDWIIDPINKYMETDLFHRQEIRNTIRNLRARRILDLEEARAIRKSYRLQEQLRSYLYSSGAERDTKFAALVENLAIEVRIAEMRNRTKKTFPK
jgi:hypothetical protein